MFDRIVVPIGLTQAFRRTLSTALLMRERFGSELHLVYLAEQEGNSEFLAGSGALLGYGAIAPDAKDQLLQFIEDSFPGRAGDFHLHVRVAHDLVDVIRRLSRELEPSLVVLTDSSHRAFFSTSKIERIVRDLKDECTVMVLPARAAGAADAGTERQ
jgi:nucleotide-binding universal stress UspA family protein